MESDQYNESVMPYVPTPVDEEVDITYVNMDNAIACINK